MSIRLGRTLPPAAAPIYFRDIVSGITGLLAGTKTRTRFEANLRKFYNVEYCFTVSSGKAALVLILQALHGLSPERDEVLIPAYTCYSVPSAIIRAGLKVRVCDLEAGGLDFDFNQLGEYLENPRLLCVISTDLYGIAADVERVKGMADKNGVWVIEDAAQSMGGEYIGLKMGARGHVGIFSLGRGKAFSTVEGGLIITDNNAIGLAIEKNITAVSEYSFVEVLKLILYAVALSVLIHPGLYWLPKLLPILKLGETHFDTSFQILRLSSFQAGMATDWQTKIERLRGARRRNIQQYIDEGISVLSVQGGILSDLIRFPILMADSNTKDMILRESERMGLGISDGYPNTIDSILQLGLEDAEYRFPRAKETAERIICLPVHPYVDTNDIERIATVLKKCVLT